MVTNRDTNLLEVVLSREDYQIAKRWAELKGTDLTSWGKLAKRKRNEA